MGFVEQLQSLGLLCLPEPHQDVWWKDGNIGELGGRLDKPWEQANGAQPS